MAGRGVLESAFSLTKRSEVPPRTNPEGEAVYTELEAYMELVKEPHDEPFLAAPPRATVGSLADSGT